MMEGMLLKFLWMFIHAASVSIYVTRRLWNRTTLNLISDPDMKRSCGTIHAQLIFGICKRCARIPLYRHQFKI